MVNYLLIRIVFKQITEYIYLRQTTKRILNHMKYNDDSDIINLNFAENMRYIHVLL